MSERTFTPRVGDGFVLVTQNGESFPARIVATDMKNVDSPIVVIATNAVGGEMLWSAGDDTRITGVPHGSFTLDPSGDYPFFTVPLCDVEQIKP